jgi:hypothetical protein
VGQVSRIRRKGFNEQLPEEFLQAMGESRDGSKEYAHNFREHGRFGSHPIHDDYDDESAAV